MTLYNERISITRQIRKVAQPETGLGQSVQGIAMTSNRRNQDRSRTEASARVGSLLFKQPHYSLLPKKGRPQPYSQIVTASTPYKDAHSTMAPSCEAAGDVGRGLGMGSNMREQPDAGSSSTLWSQHSSAVKPSFHVRKMERTTLCVNPRLSHTDTLIHCKCT